MLTKPSILLLLCSLSLAFSLTPTLQKSYFSLNPGNSFSQDLYQTRNGIVSPMIYRRNGTYFSRYFLFDLPARDAYPILSKTVSACETTPPPFDPIHHHVQTESLVYFCAANNSLLLIDQSSYTVKSEIPLKTSTSWPLIKLSSDGINVIVLAMDAFFTQTPQSSVLFIVDMQTRKLSTQTVFNQNLNTGESVVAYAAGKKGSYIATNRLDGDDLNTTVYSIIMIGSRYQLTRFSTFSTRFGSNRIATKLFCLENYVVVNSDVQVFFLNQQGSIVAKVPQVATRPIYYGLSMFNMSSFTSQSESKHLYIHHLSGNVSKYSVVKGRLLENMLGTYQPTVNIAYGNSTSGDLMFGQEYTSVFFTITDLETLNVVYSAPSGSYFNLMLTNVTYAVLASNSRLMIFDLKTDALLSTATIGGWQFDYSKEQQMISILNDTIPSGCAIMHIDLASGKIQSGLNFSQGDPICSGKIVTARITEKGNSEAVVDFWDRAVVISETYGQITFDKTEKAVNYNNIKINFDDLSLYYLIPNQTYINASSYIFDPQSKMFQLQITKKLAIPDIYYNQLFNINSTLSVAVSSKRNVTLINELSDVFHTEVPNNHSYNLATAFHDPEGKHYILFADYFNPSGYYPPPTLLCTNGSFVDLPESRLEIASAEATGSKSFALSDFASSSLTLVRFYSVEPQEKQTLISV